MNFNFICTFFVFVWQIDFFEAARNVPKNQSRKTHSTLHIKWIEIYEHDESFIGDFILKKTAVRGKVGLITFSVNLEKKIDYGLVLVCNVFQRLSSNVYQPTIVRNLKFDLCEMMKNNETLYFATRLLLPIYPRLTDFFIRYKEYIHPCPYLPGPYLINELIDELILPSFFETMDGKIECRCSDKNNHTVANVAVYTAVKKGAPAG